MNNQIYCRLSWENSQNKMMILSLIFNFNSPKMQKSMCHVCCRSDDQVKVILHFIRKRLQRISNEYIPDYRDKAQPTYKQNNAFGRLLQTILRPLPNTPPHHNCNHEKFSRYWYLRRKLKCDNLTFNNLCNELQQSIAERNYQLEILNLQLKGISDTCLRLSNDPLSQQVLKQEERKAELLQLTQHSISNQQNQVQGNDELFMQPIVAHYGSSYSSIPVLLVGVGVRPEGADSPPFPSPGTN